MRKKRFLTAFLLCAALLGAWAQARAQVQVFIQPESGFLRVEGDISITPTSSRFFLRLFPNAQITALWTEGIADYTVDRGLLGTLVTVTLNEYGSTMTLSLGYEGFLDFGEQDPIVLGRDALWYPEFSIPTAEPSFNLSLWGEWHALASPEGGYPVVVLTRDPELQWDTALSGRQVQHLDRSNVTQPPFLALPLPEEEPEEVPREVLDAEQAPEPAPQPAAPQPQVALTLVSDARYDEVSNLVLLLDRAIAERDTAGLKELISPALQADGLVDYLAAAPVPLLPLASQIRELVVQGQESFAAATMFSRGVPVYDTEMQWNLDESGRWVLAKFRMHPHVPTAPDTLASSIRQFVEELQAAAAAGSAAAIEESLAVSDAAERKMALDFLLGLNTDEPWELFVTSPQQPQVLVLVKHTPRTHVALELELVPGPTGWQIAAFKALPVD